MNKFYKWFLILSLVVFVSACSNKSSAPISLDPALEALTAKDKKLVEMDDYNFSTEFTQKTQNKTKLLGTKDGYSSVIGALGPKPGILNFYVSKPLTWDVLATKENVYVIGSLQSDTAFGVKYLIDNNNDYVNCEAFVKDLFETDGAKLDIKTTKNVNIGGKDWERVYYAYSDRTIGGMSFIDQCYKGKNYVLFIDGYVPFEIVKEKKGVIEIGVTYQDLEKMMDDFMFDEI